ncbi:MAG TPA: hypothetical protein VGF31_01100 [Myxococcaceae bacterium]
MAVVHRGCTSSGTQRPEPVESVDPVLEAPEPPLPEVEEVLL